ncbi:multisubunit potassium/proton antiporter, PhaD subunit [Nitrosomonas marina]|uniref:Multisubunit potassium/proton antiporter, PhaD subunit n=1 Tax=Nitrosomonas marina TaxID=917 RepID=A0A1I0CBQ0_9PROT|nr:monovalent cation/H+ antiporter subunit D [Nitrosomonas marina]SET16711.1 multisubunit potassium/proton antiporter, PhaD subunit [Nitrosomonas marina]
MTSHIVIFPVVLPLLAGILLLLLPRQHLPLRRTTSLTSVFLQLATAGFLLNTVNNGEILAYALGNWSPPFGIVLVADRLAVWMLVVTALVAASALLYALRGTDNSGAHFHALFQLQLFGLNGAFLTGDLFNLFVFFEILLLASYSLLLHGGGRLKTKAGLHFVVINLVGSTLFLFAVGTLYGLLGTLNMADLAVKVTQAPAEDIALIHIAGLLLFAVFALKAALLPLYLWLPAAYAYTTATVAALFAIMTKVGAYSILRVYTLIFGAQAGSVSNLIESWLLPLALLTLTVGVLGTLASTRLRQQIAYLVIASIGTLLAAFGMNTEAGIAAGLFYLPHSTFAAAALFLLADCISNRRDVMEDQFEPGPVIQQQRLLGALFFIFAALIAGLPPLSGFIGKFLILNAAMSHSALPWIMGTILITGLFTLIALARGGSMMFYRAQAPHICRIDTSSDMPRSGMSVTAELTPVLCLLVLCIALVIWAGTITEFTTGTASQLLQPELYIQSVLNLEVKP